MKKAVFFNLFGLALVSGAFAAGSYVENFESYSSISYVGQKSTTLANGAEVWGNNASAATAVNIYANSSPSWKALRLAQDGTEGGGMPPLLPTWLAPSKTPAPGLTASLRLLISYSKTKTVSRQTVFPSTLEI
jgi:hypothetical protein